MISKLGKALLVTVVVIALLACFPGNMVGYLVRMGWFQAEQLLDRTPIEEAISQGHFTDAEVEKLRLVAPIKTFGLTIGLKNTENYDTVTPRWNRTIWNISACEPLSFRPKTWWFPIVGRLSYIGAFREQDARWRERQLASRGLDVYVRKAGAYSTLGWFRDPVLPKMLKWREYSLANTLLHELAHATVWVPGSVSFNESFAAFVGDEAARRYMIDKYGEDSEEVRKMRERIEDRGTYRALMHDVYRDLDEVYSSQIFTDGDKARRKASILSSLPQRARKAGFHESDKYVRVFGRGTWNNARFVQFRTYNNSRETFRVLLDAEQGDLLAFMHRVEEVTRGRKDPYDAVAEAAGIPRD
jgi:predicted aminopeptidase